MDVDPDLEFECPKWYDFTQEDGDQDGCLDGSWFEREHPLHEPKDKEKNIQELKPLIEINETQTYINKKVGGKNSDWNTKYKKSLGVKKTVQLVRGENVQGRRRLPDTTGMKRRNSLGRLKNKNKEQDSGQMEKKRDCGNDANFTPPWGFNSPSTIPGTNGEGHMSTKAALYSPLHGPLVTPPISSPKNTLVAKAVNKAVGMNRRRILPATPCNPSTQNQEISSHLPLRATSTSQLVDQPPHQPAQDSVITIKSESPTTDTAKSEKLNPERQKNSTDMTVGDHRQNGRENPVSVEELLKQHNQKVFASKNKYDSNGRRTQKRSVAMVVGAEVDNKTGILNTIDQHNSEVFLTQDETSTTSSSKAAKNPIGVLNEDGSSVTLSSKGGASKHEIIKEMTAEDLLKLHNQRIMASKCKYDCNGRRIRTANPSFCAAPTKSDEPEKQSVAKNKGRRSASSSTACPVIKKKRLSSTTTNNETKVRLKQQRRSCIADVAAKKSNGSGRNWSVTTAGDDITTKGSDLKHNASTQGVKPALKNNRRSCVAAPVSSLQSSGISKSTNQHKRRSCVAAPQTPKRLASDSDDQELKDMIARHNKRLANNK